MRFMRFMGINIPVNPFTKVVVNSNLRHKKV